MLLHILILEHTSTNHMFLMKSSFVCNKLQEIQKILELLIKLKEDIVLSLFGDNLYHGINRQLSAHNHLFLRIEGVLSLIPHSKAQCNYWIIYRNSVYPFERHCRKNFIKAIREKPSSCWPSAPHDGCVLSFKNPLKCYGTIFFENIHNA